MTLGAGTQLGRYEIRSQIGAGGMGEVYLAQDTKLHRRVALKILTAEFCEDSQHTARFLREAQAASALNHPNICTIHEINDEGVPFIAMEYVELVVTSTEPGLRGDTAAGGASKQATLETGLAVRVPLFIKEGEIVRVNTQTGEVAGRA